MSVKIPDEMSESARPDLGNGGQVFFSMIQKTWSLTIVPHGDWEGGQTSACIIITHMKGYKPIGP